MESIHQTLSVSGLGVNRHDCRDGAVELWGVQLSTLPPVAVSLLGTAEQQRAERMRNPQQRQRYLRLKGWQRQVLALYLNCSPQEIAYDYGPQGKPGLRGTSLQFNLSHSGDRALLAVGLQPLGVDLESLERPVRDPLALARRFFGVTEVQELQRLTAMEQRQAFLRSWVVKEAYLKGLGTGLGGQLEALEYRSAHPGGLLQQGAPVTWSIRSGAPWPRWWMAIATLTPPREYRWHCRPEDEENP